MLAAAVPSPPSRSPPSPRSAPSPCAFAGRHGRGPLDLGDHAVQVVDPLDREAGDQDQRPPARVVQRHVAAQRLPRGIPGVGQLDVGVDACRQRGQDADAAVGERQVVDVPRVDAGGRARHVQQRGVQRVAAGVGGEVVVELECDDQRAAARLDPAQAAPARAEGELDPAAVGDPVQLQPAFQVVLGVDDVGDPALAAQLGEVTDPPLFLVAVRDRAAGVLLPPGPRPAAHREAELAVAPGDRGVDVPGLPLRDDDRQREQHIVQLDDAAGGLAGHRGPDQLQVGRSRYQAVPLDAVLADDPAVGRAESGGVGQRVGRRADQALQQRVSGRRAAIARAPGRPGRHRGVRAARGGSTRRRPRRRRAAPWRRARRLRAVPRRMGRPAGPPARRPCPRRARCPRRRPAPAPRSPGASTARRRPGRRSPRRSRSGRDRPAPTSATSTAG